MNKHHAGAGPVMHPTVISEPSCLGPYPKILAVGETQSMVFQEGDDGPFYYTEVERREKKYDRLTGNKKKRDLKKSELINLLQAKLGSSFKAQTYRSLEELKILANNNNIAVEVEEDEVDLGWMHKSKGLLQVLWERGWIDPNENINNYVKDKKQKWLDPNGNVLPEFTSEAKKFVLTNLLAECLDFKYEKSAMQKLAEDLSRRHQRKIDLLITPKYHCELAGEGIEYGWGFFKKDYRRIPHAEKKGRDLFRSCVKKSLKKVTVEHIRRFSARARRYMLTYMLLDSPESLEGHGLSYHEIEQYVGKK